jgi:hypothetical protein
MNTYKLLFNLPDCPVTCMVITQRPIPRMGELITIFYTDYLVDGVSHYLQEEYVTVCCKLAPGCKTSLSAAELQEHLSGIKGIELE